MMEKPIIFSGPMVEAILDGHKTQTRRPIGVWPSEEAIIAETNEAGWIIGEPFKDGMLVHRVVKCPYEVGMRLWIRETWAAVHFDPAYSDGITLSYSDYWYGSKSIPKDSQKGFWIPCYRAGRCWEEEIKDRGFRWRPSIHMPRWASRITLRILNVEAERLWDITDTDAIAEGIVTDSVCSEILAFANLWDSLNAKRGYGWNLNPWVWVLKFERL